MNTHDILMGLKIREMLNSEEKIVITTNQIKAVSFGDSVMFYYDYIAKTEFSGAIKIDTGKKNGEEVKCKSHFRYYLHMY